MLAKKTLIPYFTFGHPTVAFTLELVDTAFSAGADVVELGIPFSDPIADGPVIQASHTKALSTGEDVSIAAALQAVSEISKKWPNKSIVLMLASNLVIQFGIPKFFSEAEKSGVKGVIIPDLPLEFAKEYRNHKVKLILLLSTLTPEKRMKQIVKATQGFLYLISSKGITGERATIQTDLSEIIQKIRQIRPIPIAIGFGISTKDQVEKFSQLADGVIIGSYFERIVQESTNLSQAKETVFQKIQEFSLAFNI